MDEDDLITVMAKKFPMPAIRWCCPPFYYYTKADAKRVKNGIATDCGADAPGSFIALLYKTSPVHTMEVPGGSRYDIVNPEG